MIQNRTGISHAGAGIIVCACFSMTAVGFGAGESRSSSSRPAVRQTSPWSKVVLPGNRDIPSKDNGFESVTGPPENNLPESLKKFLEYDDSDTFFPSGYRDTLVGAGKKTPEKTEFSIPAGLKGVSLPSPASRIVCELRIASPSSGKVVRQVSGMAYFDERKLLAEKLADELVNGMEGNKIVVVALCNRRETRTGLRVSYEWTNDLVKAIEGSTKFRRIKLVDLRGKIGSERDIESSTKVLSPKYRSIIGNAKYVVIGGMALSRHPASIDEYRE